MVRSICCVSFCFSRSSTTTCPDLSSNTIDFGGNRRILLSLAVSLDAFRTVIAKDDKEANTAIITSMVVNVDDIIS